jgi:hypothetical protein
MGSGILGSIILNKGFMVFGILICFRWQACSQSILGVSADNPLVAF